MKRNRRLEVGQVVVFPAVTRNLLAVIGIESSPDDILSMVGKPVTVDKISRSDEWGFVFPNGSVRFQEIICSYPLCWFESVENGAATTQAG